MLKKIFYGFLIGIICVIIAFYIFGKIQQQVYLSNVERVNVIHLSGTIEESTPDYIQNINPRLVSDKLNRAARDNTIKGVVLRINSPGGSVAASQEIEKMVRDFNKPIVVSMGDTAASGGYYISVSADKIVAQPGTMTGSIGVIMQTINPEKLLEKIGIEREIIKSGKHKDMFQGDLNPEEREILQDISDEAYNQFVSAVAKGRNLEEAQVEELATGQIYIGTQAEELGLVDKLGGIEEAIDVVSEIAGLRNPVRYEYPPPGLFERMQSGIYSLVPAWIGKSGLPEELLYWKEVLSESSFSLRYQLK